MKTKRTVLQIDSETPGTEIAAETSAAMAASSIVFRSVDRIYARRLLNKAKLVPFTFIKHLVYIRSWKSCDSLLNFLPFDGMKLFHLAKSHKGTYDGECPFYCSYSGYNVITALVTFFTSQMYLVLEQLILKLKLILEKSF